MNITALYPSLPMLAAVREVIPGASLQIAHPDDMMPVLGGALLVGLAGRLAEDRALTEQVPDLLSQVRPSFLAWENVRGWAAESRRADIEERLRAIEKEGYIHRHRVLDSARFGAATSSKRLWIIATRRHSLIPRWPRQSRRPHTFAPDASPTWMAVLEENLR